jgi:hypothetical protein
MDSTNDTAEGSGRPPCSTASWLESKGTQGRAPGGSRYWEVKVDDEPDGRCWLRIHDADSSGGYGVEIYSETYCANNETIEGGGLLGHFSELSDLQVLVDLILKGYSLP